MTQTFPALNAQSEVAGPLERLHCLDGIEPLAGYTIAITAARRREEFGAALERRGARVVFAPAIRIIPLADDSELRRATEECLSAPLDFVVATTGIGFRGWMEAADTWGMGERLNATLATATVLARGPKARGAVRATALREAWSPESESSSEVLEHLTTQHQLEGKRVAVQLHGQPLPDMVNTLRMFGAEVIEVPVYRWAPPEDTAPLRRVLESVASVAGGINCVAFTSAPAAASFLSSADELGLGQAVRAALRGPVLPACVGAVTARPLLDENIPVIQPVRARLGTLIHEIVKQLPEHSGQSVPAAGHTLDVRGHAVVVDDRFVALSSSSMVLLRALISRPGQVISRTELMGLAAAGADEHAIEVAIGRLRTSLGDPRIIQTVVKRGYRLSYEPERAVAPAGWRY